MKMRLMQIDVQMICPNSLMASGSFSIPLIPFVFLSISSRAGSITVSIRGEITAGSLSTAAWSGTSQSIIPDKSINNSE